MKSHKGLPQSNLPREKLLNLGSGYLSNAELLAIILGSGTKNQDVFSMSEKIFPNRSMIFSIITSSPQEISKQLQIPLHHALKLAALFTLLERLKNTSQAYIFTPSDIFRQFYHIAGHKKEHLVGVYLNSRNKKILDEVITIGTINQSLFPINEILAIALTTRASSIVIIHNHPSGDPSPSNEDIKMTKKLISACDLLNIVLLDHVIISENKYFSFSEKGLF